MWDTRWSKSPESALLLGQHSHGRGVLHGARGHRYRSGTPSDGRGLGTGLSSPVCHQVATPFGGVNLRLRGLSCPGQANYSVRPLPNHLLWPASHLSLPYGQSRACLEQARHPPSTVGPSQSLFQLWSRSYAELQRPATPVARRRLGVTSSTAAFHVQIAPVQMSNAQLVTQERGSRALNPIHATMLHPTSVSSMCI